MDNTLRGLLNDLAVTRVKRKNLEKNEALLVSVDEVDKKFARAESELRRRRKVEVDKRVAFFAARRVLLISWKREFRRFSLTIHRRKKFG